MEIEKYIVQFDNLLQEKENNLFIKCIKDGLFKFDEAEVFDYGQQTKNKQTRTTDSCAFFNIGASSKTMIYWANKFKYVFAQKIKEYMTITNTKSNSTINDIQLLKYKEGGFYKEHVDHCPNAPRNLSFIYLVNDDYEGGELVFKLPYGKNISVEVNKNKLLIWPSNFLYPHQVNPVKKGEKYSLVSWAL